MRVATTLLSRGCRKQSFAASSPSRLSSSSSSSSSSPPTPSPPSAAPPHNRRDERERGRRESEKEREGERGERGAQLLHGKYLPSASAHAVPPRPRVRDAVVVGGGHNGLVCAAYLAKAGMAFTPARAVYTRRPLTSTHPDPPRPGPLPRPHPRTPIPHPLGRSHAVAPAQAWTSSFLSAEPSSEGPP